MTDTSPENYLQRTAWAAYVLLYDDARYKESSSPLEYFGPFADVIAMLRQFHQDAIALTVKTGKVYEVYEDARTAWEGMRASDDGTKQYNLLDKELHKIAYALERDEGATAPDWAPPIPATPVTNGTVIHAADAPPTEIAYAIRPPTAPVDSNDMLALERRPVKWFAPSFLREGLGLLVGLPQVGKTPLAIQLAIALATGTKWMGRVVCRKTKVLYLGVEYTQQELIPLLDISRCGQDIPRGMLTFKTMEDDFPRETDAALAELDWYIRALEIEVIIIDVLTAFLPPEKFKQNLYRGDYTELKPYHRLASLHSAAILGTWHGSKRETDPRIMYNGGVGMWAVPASRMALYTDQDNRVRLSSFPRMCDRIDWALTQEKTANGHRWVVADAAPEPLLSALDLEIYRCIKNHAEPTRAIGPSTVAELTGIKIGTVKSGLSRMYEKNIIHAPPTGGGYFVETATYETDTTYETPATDATYETFATDATLATPLTQKRVANDLALERGKPEGLQGLHESTGFTDSTKAPSLSALPRDLRRTTYMMLISPLERNQKQAQTRCEEYGLDYETLRAWALKQSRNEKEQRL